jgi:glucose-1-phosphate thymidylyltransferase
MKQQVIGLLPAAGQATRLAPLPFSKELYPVGFYSNSDGRLKPKVVCHYLLEKMQLAGINKAYIVLRPGKWDIPNYFGDGTMVGMRLGYLTVHVPYGVPYTLNQAYPFVNDSLIALGFPDILFEPQDAFVRVLVRQAATNADVVLGLFPTGQSQKAGMVDFDQHGRVHQVVEKPQQTNLRYMWAIAIWTPTFTQFLHDYLETLPIPSGSAKQSGNPDQEKQALKYSSSQQELPIGDVIQAAINQHLQVRAEVFPQGTYLDIGTPGDLIQAIRDYT